MGKKRKSTTDGEPSLRGSGVYSIYKKPRLENRQHGITTSSNFTSENVKIQAGSSLTPLPSLSPSLPALPLINPDLARAVFTHSSVIPSAQHTSSHELTYERLEFLGDAYIEVIATRLIWEQYRSLPAGRLSQIRESLVKNETLNAFARDYQFDARIKVVGRDFVSEDPKRWLKVVADVFEAYVAAVILSDPVSGFRKAEDWLTELWQPRLEKVEAKAPNLKAKEELARKIAGKGIKLDYREEKPVELIKGGMQSYFIGVYLTGWGWENQHLGSGRGLNKVGAGNDAAAWALRENAELLETIAMKRKEILDEEKAKKTWEEQEELKVYA